MKKTFLFFTYLFCCALFQPIYAQIIITQYYEGGGYNKWIELTNIGNASVDLSEYKMAMWTRTTSDGSKIVYDGEPDKTAQLSGLLEGGKSVLIGRDNNDGEVSYISDYLNISSVTNFNGNDGLALLDADNNIIDRFCDSISAKDDTYIRNDDILQPNPESDETEWSKMAIEDVQNATSEQSEYLGFHAVVSVPKKISAQIITPVDTFYTTDTLTIEFETFGPIDSLILYAKPANAASDYILLAQLGASAETFSMAIPDSAETGEFCFVVMDYQDTTCYDFTDTITIKQLEYPELAMYNNHLVVKPNIALEDYYTTDYGNLAVIFEDSLLVNAGNIYVIGSNDSLIWEPDQIISDTAKVDTLIIDVNDYYRENSGRFDYKYDELLEPNFFYYVAMDSGTYISYDGMAFQGLSLDSEVNWRFKTGQSKEPEVEKIKISTVRKDESYLNNGVFYSISGIVTIVKDSLIFIQDSGNFQSGIIVVSNENVQADDSVNVKGIITQIEKNLVICASDLSVVSSFNNPVKCTSITLDDVGEYYEAMYISLPVPLKVTSVSGDTITVSKDEYQLRIRCSDREDIEVGCEVSKLKGVLLQQNDEFILYPTKSEDIELRSVSITDKSVENKLSCHQINNQLVIETENTGTVDLIDLTGKSLLQVIVKDKITIDISSVKRGIYLLRFRKQKGEISIIKVYIS